MLCKWPQTLTTSLDWPTAHCLSVCKETCWGRDQGTQKLPKNKNKNKNKQTKNQPKKQNQNPTTTEAPDLHLSLKACTVYNSTYTLLLFRNLDFLETSAMELLKKNFLQLYCPNGISPMRNSGAFFGESQMRQSRATQPRVHAGCFSVSIIHRTLTWTTGSLTCAQL